MNAASCDGMSKNKVYKLVVLESPYSGDIAINVRYAQECLKDALLRGEAPIASHLLYTQPNVLDDEVAYERQLGIDAGLSWCECAHAVVVYTDLGISDGMRLGIERATSLGVPVEYRMLRNN